MRRLEWISGAALVAVLGFPAWSAAGAAPLQPLTLTKTVGLDPASCAAAKGISVVKGTTVYYCYTITNNDVVSYTMHSLEDSVLGWITLPNGGDFFLEPQESMSVTSSFQINVSTFNVATWAAVPTTGTMTQVATAPFAADTVATATSAAAVSIDPKAAPALGEAALAFVAAGLLAFGAIRLSRKLRDPS